MAFEAFRAGAGGGTRPRARWRTLMYVGSAAVHVALILVGVAYSFWHVEELSPPRLQLTFMSAAPPPPPPAPPPGGGGANAPKKKVPKARPVEQKPNAIVQPKDTQKVVKPPDEEPKPRPGDGQKGGVIGGTVGGTIGGTIGGDPGGKIGGEPGGKIGGTGAAPAAKLMPQHLGAAQKLSGADPPFPASLRKTGMTYRVMVKICVTTTGTVDKVIMSKGADPLLDDGVIATVKTWRYRPLAANDVTVPFCYPALFEFKAQ